MQPLRYISWKSFLLGGVAGAAVAGAIFFLADHPAPALSHGGALRHSSSTYQLIDPLLACEIGPEEDFPELNPIKNAVTAAVNDAEASGSAQSISVYFRQLDTSKWFSVNGDHTYAPASLLKVMVMMAYYKEADDTDNPALLQQEVVFQGSPTPTSDPLNPSIPSLVPGKLYSIERIIEEMILYSDDNALNTLTANFDPQTSHDFELMFKDLDIPLPAVMTEKSLNFVSVDDYSLVFRVLYGSTYLSERYSSRALALLARAAYKGGLPAGVPATLMVAHKYGITAAPDPSTQRYLAELHDCGIVYYPGSPYLLCIMTAGGSFPSLQSDIARISKAVYQGYQAYAGTK